MSATLRELSIGTGEPLQAQPHLDQLKLQSRLPSPKGVALAIMDLCRSETATLESIARVIQTDPALTARLLYLANAATMYAGRPVAAIPEAIRRLGLGVVRQVATGFSLVDQYRSGPCKHFDYARFWSHSLLMAVAIQHLGNVRRVGSPDELFSCGLMARIGCLALATAYPDEYSQIVAECEGDQQLTTLERQRLQADHNDFTASILLECGIPKALVEPAFYHEHPGDSGFTEGSRPYQLVHLLYHAKRLADMGTAPEAERGNIISELMLLGGELGLDAIELGHLVDRILTHWRAWAELLKVPFNTLPSFAHMATAPAPKIEAQQGAPPPIRVLLVEDEPLTRTTMEAMLQHIAGRKIYTACNGQEAMARALEIMPHIIVTDWQMPVMNGIDLCRALRATEWGQSIYLIMLTGIDAEEEVIQAFEAGVDDYVTKPVNERAVRARMRAALHYVQLRETWERDRAQLKQFAAALATTNRRLQHAAHTDLLTGLPNRRAGLDILNHAWSTAARSGQMVAVMMVDVDHFKSINDTHGHAVGDKVLVELGKVIRSAVRSDDQVCRLGGEEFLVVCQDTDVSATLQVAERLRANVLGTPINVNGVQIQATVSIGIACKEPAMADVDELVKAADKALYGAKHAGRNRTCLMTEGRIRVRHA
jgi:two-component system, cell cycle response regulator